MSLPNITKRLRTSLWIILIFLGLYGLHFIFSASFVFFSSIALLGIMALTEWLNCASWPSGPLGSVVILMAMASFAWIYHTFGYASFFFIILNAILSDSAGYFAGSLLKGPKLCPSISPNKTVSGALVAFVLCLLFAWIWQQQNFSGFRLHFSFLPSLAPWMFSFLMAIAAPLGDLAESAVKRRCGLKETGNLLPGHGGILDRIDSWIGSVLMFQLLVFLGFVGPKI